MILSQQNRNTNRTSIANLFLKKFEIHYINNIYRNFFYTDLINF